MLGTGFINYGAYTGYPLDDKKVRELGAHDSVDRIEDWANARSVPPLNALVDAVIELGANNYRDARYFGAGYKDYGDTFIIVVRIEFEGSVSGWSTLTFEFETSAIAKTGYSTLYAYTDIVPDTSVPPENSLEQAFGAFVVSYEFIKWLNTLAGAPPPSMWDELGYTGPTFPDASTYLIQAGSGEGIPFYPSVVSVGAPRVRSLLVADTEIVLLPPSESYDSYDHYDEYDAYEAYDHYDEYEAVEIAVDRKLQGDIQLIPGFNMQIEQDIDGGFTLSAVPGAGEGIIRCTDRGILDIPVRNGNLRADDDGDILIQSGDGCIRVRQAAENTFIIENICEPCCSCENYVDLIDEIDQRSEALITSRKALDVSRARQLVLAQSEGNLIPIGDYSFLVWCGLTSHTHVMAPGVEDEVRYFMVVMVRTPYQAQVEIEIQDPSYRVQESRIDLGSGSVQPSAGQTSFSGLVDGVLELILCYGTKTLQNVTVTIDGVEASYITEDLT